MTQDLVRNGEFIGYPRDYVLGIFDESEAAESAVTELISAGFGDSELLVLSTPADARQVDEEGVHHGIEAAATRTIQELGDKDTLDECAKALRAGCAVVGAHAEDECQREQANLIMQESGGQSIRYFGRFVVEDLDTAPNQPRP